MVVIFNKSNYLVSFKIESVFFDILFIVNFILDNFTKLREIRIKISSQISRKFWPQINYAELRHWFCAASNDVC